MRRIVEQFNPAWGAAVMGTGVLSILLAGLGGGFAVGALVLFLLNTLILLYALTCWLLMWFVTPQKIRKLIDDAGMLVFLPTVPVGVVVWVNNLMVLHGRFFPFIPQSVPAALWAGASALILFLAVHFFDRIFISSHIDITHSTFGWLIPPVALLIIPLGVPSFLPLFSPATGKAVLVGAFGVWGAGFFSYLFVNAAVTHRYFFHEMPPSQMTPSVWVGLGPVGAGAAGLLSLSKLAESYETFEALAVFGKAFAVLLWGFGVVWYIVSLVLTFRKAFFERIPYTMGWWAFTFPLGAYTLATRMLFLLTQIELLRAFSLLLLVNLVVFWIITAYRTTKFVLGGQSRAQK
ncbi:C4-dicarboxylate transporter/malic acid transport protein [Spirochaeta thermophila DSM 6578]|uniref:C4-dicarboxylate transporter/malic acid transport protein n=1 Tax=Winmispira thermophila (strain ATCC 700085 / DSM 6578 / Z-1203) TaxID=869211 RepID=G0GE94_WINT7|nr:C4-dicarboxylate transporter/malic acid transporter [Spirochaeta thermophila]AEJ61447.1 C4-dicarboxylate transporter/malic acid transport protein [Spirochaeta thermophila DSM 6578]